MSIVAIIPARGGSKGIPRKNLIDFCGKPLLAWSIEHACATEEITQVFVSTDNAEIRGVAQKSGALVIDRPQVLAGDTTSSEDVLIHAVGEIKKRGISCDDIVFLQATSPLRERDDISNAIVVYRDGGFDSLFSASALTDCCLWKKGNEVLTSVTYDYAKRGMRQNREPYYLENGSIYIMKRSVLEKNHNRLGGHMGMYLMPFWKSFEIDDLDDVALCASVMAERIIREK